MKKRILSMVTILCLLLALFPVTAFAETPIYNASNIHGIEPWKEYCGDTFFTIDIPTEEIKFVLYTAGNPGSSDTMTPDEAGRYKLYADWGNTVVDIYLKEGARICISVYIHADHTDNDNNHVCDVCSEPLTNKCVDENPKDHKCDVCGAKLSEHSGGTATCVKKATCDYCGEEYGTTNPDNHAGGTVVRNAKEATCTEDGYTGYTHCKDCGTKLSNGTTIEATGHTDENKDHICDVETCKEKLSDHSGGTATCVKKATCDYCGEEYGSTNPDNHAGGTEVLNAKEATCTEDGYTGNTFCKDCGTKLSNGTLIPATGHDFGEDGKCKCGAVKFTVTFDANGGSVDTATAITDLTGKLSALPTPTREGYVFDSWYTEKEGGTKVGADTVYTAHTTLYAHWRKIVTRLDFSLSGYGYKKPFIDTTVTPGAGNEGATYGDNYAGYGDYYGIVTDQNSLEALSSGVFREEKDYFLYVTFFEAEGFTLSDLKGENIFLNGAPALAVVRKDGQMTAVFDLRTIYLIKATAGKNGEIDPEGTVAVFEGDDITFTITPDDGYLRSTVKVDGKKVKNAKTYTFEDVQESHTIQATFVKSTNPKTGDDSGMQWVFHALTISAGALAALLILRKKKRAA